jgi:group I intron endonuclease
MDTSINYVKLDSILIDDRLVGIGAICGIYLWVNTFNQKVYVGQSVHIKRRIIDELRHIDQVSNKHLQNAIAKHMEYFCVSLIKKCAKEDLDFYEQIYIRLYCSWDNRYGYNKSLGGSKTYFVKEVRNRISKGHTGLKLRSFTEQHKAKLRLSNIQPGKQKFSRPVVNIDTGEIYSSIRDCVRKTGLGDGFRALVRDVCNKKYKQVKGFRLRWELDD